MVIWFHCFRERAESSGSRQVSGLSIVVVPLLGLALNCMLRDLAGADNCCAVLCSRSRLLWSRVCSGRGFSRRSGLWLGDGGCGMMVVMVAGAGATVKVKAVVAKAGTGLA